MGNRAQIPAVKEQRLKMHCDHCGLDHPRLYNVENRNICERDVTLYVSVKGWEGLTLSAERYLAQWKAFEANGTPTRTPSEHDRMVREARGVDMRPAASGALPMFSEDREETPIFRALRCLTEVS